MSEECRDVGLSVACRQWIFEKSDNWFGEMRCFKDRSIVVVSDPSGRLRLVSTAELCAPVDDFTKRLEVSLQQCTIHILDASSRKCSFRQHELAVN